MKCKSHTPGVKVCETPFHNGGATSGVSPYPCPLELAAVWAENASLSSSSSFPSSSFSSSRGPRRRSRRHHRCLRCPPGRHRRPARRCHSGLGPHSARGAGHRVAARGHPRRGPPRPLAADSLQKSREQRWQRRTGEGARVRPPRREWATPGDDEERPSQRGESTPVPRSPVSAARRRELDVSLAGQAMVSKPQANDH